MASKLEEKFLEKIRESGFPEPLREYVFHQPENGEKQRKFRFDFCYPVQKIAIEIEGGTWKGKGRHTSGIGYARDCEKYNLALIQGWKVLRFTKVEGAIDTLRELMEQLNVTTEDLWRTNGA